MSVNAQNGAELLLDKCQVGWDLSSVMLTYYALFPTLPKNGKVWREHKGDTLHPNNSLGRERQPSSRLV